MTEFFPLGACAITLISLWSAFTDLVYRRITNRAVVTVLAVTLIGFLWIEKGGASWRSLWEAGGSSAITGSLLVFVIGLGLNLFGKVGAGDVKMSAALMLWMGDDGLLFLLAMSLAGGAMVLGLPLVRQVEETLSLFVYRHDVQKRPPACLQSTLKGLPYGPAIAAGVVTVTLLRLF